MHRIMRVWFRILNHNQVFNPLRFDNIKSISSGRLSNSVAAVQQSMSLFVFLRHVARLPGTKVMCFEGGCGACVVTASYQLPGSKEDVIKAVNAVKY